ncbi:MAG: CBS domain-containing protein [Actinobacteria bacterium]|nr:CBS domain-containing protein [Actinomycetota bacterium]
MKVNELMTRDPATLHPGSTATEAAALMKSKDCGSLPIVEGGRLVGIVTDRDIVLRVVAARKDPATVKISEIMTKDPATVGPEATAAEASKLMSDKQVRRLPVVENTKLVGMLVIGQLARHESNSAAGDTLKDVSQKR